jgi:hypothetical protein
VQLRQAAEAGDPAKFEDARRAFLSAIEQAGGATQAVPLTEEAMAAYELQMACYAGAGMEGERRRVLDVLLDAIPGEVPAEAAFAGVTRIAEAFVHPIRFAVPLLLTTPRHTIQLHPPRGIPSARAAAQALSRFAEAYPDAAQSPQALLNSMMICIYDARDLGAAQRVHETLQFRYGDAAEARRADYLFGVASIYLGDSDAARAALSRVNGGPPGGPDAAAAASLMGVEVREDPQPRDPTRTAYAYNMDGRNTSSILLMEIFYLVL